MKNQRLNVRNSSHSQSVFEHDGWKSSNLANEPEPVPHSLHYQKEKSGTQLNEKPLFCF